MKNWAQTLDKTKLAWTDFFFKKKKKKKRKKMHIGHKYGIATKFWPKFWHFGFAGSSKDVSENLQAPSNYGCTRLV